MSMAIRTARAQNVCGSVKRRPGRLPGRRIRVRHICSDALFSVRHLLVVRFYISVIHNIGYGRSLALSPIQGLQAFSAENLLCILQLLILLTFRHQVIKKGIRKPLHLGLQNQDFLPMREPIIYESLFDRYEQ